MTKFNSRCARDVQNRDYRNTPCHIPAFSIIWSARYEFAVGLQAGVESLPTLLPESKYVSKLAWGRQEKSERY